MKTWRRNSTAGPSPPPLQVWEVYEFTAELKQFMGIIKQELVSFEINLELLLFSPTRTNWLSDTVAIYIRQCDVIKYLGTDRKHEMYTRYCVLYEIITKCLEY